MRRRRISRIETDRYMTTGAKGPEVWVVDQQTNKVVGRFRGGGAIEQRYPNAMRKAQKFIEKSLGRSLRDDELR